jgi:hypothetical protein
MKYSPLSFGLVVAFLWGWTAAAEAPVPLPVRQVVLFKNGIGYFQHQGSVPGAQPVEIRLSSSQLDDVLKSLTVLDLDGGKIVSVSYDSEASLDRRMSELPVDPRQAETLGALLNQLKGSEVELEAPAGTVSGRLVSAELRSFGRDGGAGQRLEVSVLTAGGKVQVVPLESAGGLRFLSTELAEDLARALDLMAGAVEGDVRRLTINLGSSGDRRLFVGYTAEAPIWKTTYRAVLQEKGTLLQGWAVVDNTTPMPWEDIELSLVSGAPVSFIYRLSQPIYGDRPEVPVLAGIQVRPEVHGAAVAVEAEGAVPMQASKEAFRARSLPGAPPREVAALDLADAIRQSGDIAAEAASRAEQFEYRIRDRVSIGRNQSALIPILQADVTSEKVTVFNESTDGIPRLAIWLTNNTGMTLDGGSITIIDAGVYAGESLMTSVQPNERRLLSYAVDLGVQITTRFGSDRRAVESITASRGILRMVRKLVETRTYTVRNQASQAKTVVLEHPVRSGWELAGTVKPVESSAEFHRFRLTAPPAASTSLAVVEERPEESVFRLAEASVDQLGVWIRDRALSEQARQALNTIIERKRRVAALQEQLEQSGTAEKRIFSDQERLRGNLAGLGQTVEESRLRQRYIDQLEAQENQLAELRARRTALEQELEQARLALAEAIEALSF